MAGSTKCVMKLHEYTAHGADVNCLALGHKSGHVLVTGGDDKKINLWAVGNSNCIMSLPGHTTPVHCVRFSHTENHVCAGSAAGALKIWDLEAAKMMRALTGHSKSVRAIEFHPYCDIITTGSVDTSIKLWDLRRKGCIFMYEGHTMAVNSLKFSPDGQWIASAGQEGAVKLWDLRSRAILKEFTEHTGPATSVEFHPHEFLLASAAQDNSVKFWDLEHFNLVSSTPIEVPHARCLHFCSSGKCLYAAGHDILRTHLWEPGRTVNTTHANWGRIQDIATTNSKLVGASFNQRNVSVWLVDLNQLVQSDPGDESSPVRSPFAHGNSLRKSFNKQKPTPEAKKSLTVRTIEESERSETDPEDEILPEISNDYRSIFQPNRTSHTSYMSKGKLCNSFKTLQLSKAAAIDFDSQAILTRSPPPSAGLSPPSRQFNNEDTIITAPQMMEVDNIDVTVYRQRSVSPHDSSREPSSRRLSFMEDTSDHEPEFPVKLSSIHHSASETSIPRVGNHVQQRTSVKHQIKATSQSSLVSNIPVLSSTTNRNNSKDFAPPSSYGSSLDLEEFLPKSCQRKLHNSQNIPDLSESEVLSSLMRDHEPVSTILEARHRNLQIVYSMWHSKDLKAATDAAIGMCDNSVIVDFLSVITNMPNVWTLDVCVLVLPAIQDLLQSKYDTHMKAGCDALRVILRNFSLLIRTNVMSGSLGHGVDICREERYNKCMKCYSSLMEVRSALLRRQTLQGPIGHAFRELLVSLQAIDQPD